MAGNHIRQGREAEVRRRSGGWRGRVCRRTPITVVCSGAKSILDVGATLERLETLNVTLLGYRTDRFPGFYLDDSGFPVPWRVDSPEDRQALFWGDFSMEDFGYGRTDTPWQRWTASLTLPTQGYYEIWSRATDSDGRMQPHVAANWNPQGYGGNAFHRIVD